MSRLTFHVVDSLTGKIVGRLYPYEWEWTDPLTGHATGTLRVKLPAADEVAELAARTRPRTRWVAVEDEKGRFPFAGPITRRPAREGGTVVVPVADWRRWFYWAFLRPGPNGENGDYVRVSPKIEQATAMTDLMLAALDTVGAPHIVVDAAADTEVLRQVTFRQLATSVGACLDNISNRPDGAEWYTYVTKSADGMTLLVHAAVAYPERGTGKSPHRVEHRVAFEAGRGGNVVAYDWPEGPEAPTRVFALGEGEPPAQVWAKDENPDLTDGLEVAWEEVTGPHAGVTEADTAFQHAANRVELMSGLSGPATFTIADDDLAIGDVQVGDRARLLLDDGWESVDLPGARIISRRVTGGKDRPLQQALTLDLGDGDPIGAEEPGVPGEGEV